MTKRPEHPAPAVGRCAWCHRQLPPQTLGRPRRFCRQSHRQRAYEARRLAGSLGLAPGRELVDQGDLRRLWDALYALEAAIEDVEQHLADEPGACEAALDHLLAAARPVAAAVLEPVAAP